MLKHSTESIWLQLSSDLRRFIRRRVSDDHVAEDLLQDTFVRIHCSLATLHDEERLAAWVMQIARNTIRDHYRRTSASELRAEDDLAEPTDGPLDELRCRLGQWMPELIALLPEGYREALTLSEINGLTQQQVADQLGLTLSGAKSRVQRARTLLREVLDQCCAFQVDHAGRVMDCDPRPERKVCKDCGDR